jgi:hypothetical protein
VGVAVGAGVVLDTGLVLEAEAVDVAVASGAKAPPTGAVVGEATAVGGNVGTGVLAL